MWIVFWFTWLIWLLVGTAKLLFTVVRILATKVLLPFLRMVWEITGLVMRELYRVCKTVEKQ